MTNSAGPDLYKSLNPIKKQKFNYDVTICCHDITVRFFDVLVC